jgi:hypothetical protein
MHTYLALSHVKDGTEIRGRHGQVINFGVPVRLIIWHPLKPILFKSLRPRAGLAKILRARDQIAYNFFWEILPHVETWVCWHHYYLLLQWRLSAPYRLAPRSAVLLAHPLVPPCLCAVDRHSLPEVEQQQHRRCHLCRATLHRNLYHLPCIHTV